MSRQLLRWAPRMALCAVAGCLSWFLAAALFVLLPPVLGYEGLVVTGGSMGKALPAGSVAVIRDVDPTSLESGDVITYVGESGVAVTHRIIRVDESSDGPVFTTHGDANQTPDPAPVHVTAIKGEVVMSVGLAGYLAVFIASPGFLLFLGGAALVLFCGFPRIRRRGPSLPAAEPS